MILSAAVIRGTTGQSAKRTALYQVELFQPMVALQHRFLDDRFIDDACSQGGLVRRAQMGRQVRVACSTSVADSCSCCKDRRWFSPVSAEDAVGIEIRS